MPPEEDAVLTKSELVAEVTEATGLKKKEVAAVVEAALAVISARLRKHEKVRLTGFGSFEPRKRKARTGVNPRTGEKIRVGVTWSLVFRPSKELKRLISGKSAR